jgi:di/tricarboxylate transporter
MAITGQTPPAALAGARRAGWLTRNRGLLLAIAGLAVVLSLPTPESLPVAGHRMLAILAFAVIIWMTEAVDYAVSAIAIGYV